MARIEQLPIREVAAVLEIPVNTAYTRLRKANQEFAEAVKRLRLRQRASRLAGVVLTFRGDLPLAHERSPPPRPTARP